MRILHTADLHLGQIIYRHYDRRDEHEYFFSQLAGWCREFRPDALIVSGDLYDVPQPSAATRHDFNRFFASLHSDCPDMCIVAIGGNHDSASRIGADSPVWGLANVIIRGNAPADDFRADDFIVRLPSGYIIALPYSANENPVYRQKILDHVSAENSEGKPVVMTGHLAVSGLDTSGHDFEAGRLKTVDAAGLGTGYDYMALGHIHMPQTIGHRADAMAGSVTYPAPVIRYSGSALHVSCDETYPHSVSLVEIDRHMGEVSIRQLRIKQLRGFHTLPPDADSSFMSADSAIEAVGEFASSHARGYIRLRMDHSVSLPPDFNQRIYDMISHRDNEIRYNPKIIWSGNDDDSRKEVEKPVFQVAELQQMTDPMIFVERTAGKYPDLDIEILRTAFDEVKAEVARMGEASGAQNKQL